MDTIAKNIRKYRKLKGMTQVQLAEALGLQQYNITNYERGTRLPSADKILEIAKVLNVGIADIYGQKGTSVEASQVPRTAHNARTKQMQEVFESLSSTEQRIILKQAKALLQK